MFQKLANHNEDLRRLVDKGYAVAFDGNHLVVRDIPYLDSESRLQVGAIVAKLEFIDQDRVTQTDHQVFFAGVCTVRVRPQANSKSGWRAYSACSE